ncbi:hypothetical protein ANCCAN_25198, partial [Ancylostoma caninum]
FDSREHWKNCSEIIDYIRDQSACGGCWAVAAASAMGDRACIASNGKFKVSMYRTKDTENTNHLYRSCSEASFRH